MNTKLPLALILWLVAIATAIYSLIGLKHNDTYNGGGIEFRTTNNTHKSTLSFNNSSENALALQIENGNVRTCSLSIPQSRQSSQAAVTNQQLGFGGTSIDTYTSQSSNPTASVGTFTSNHQSSNSISPTATSGLYASNMTNSSDPFAEDVANSNIMSRLPGGGAPPNHPGPNVPIDSPYLIFLCAIPYIVIQIARRKKNTEV